MRRLRAWFLRLGGLFHKGRRDRELAEELESHLQMHIEDSLRCGMTPAEARRQAVIKLGGLEQTKEICRDRRGLPFLETFLQDLRYGLRMLQRSPGTTAVAVMSLAIAIGPNCALFSVVDRLILKPPPVQGIGHIFGMYVRSERPGEWQRTSYPDLQDYQALAGDVASFAARFDRRVACWIPPTSG